MATYRFQLEDASGCLLLADGSSYFLQEIAPTKWTVVPTPSLVSELSMESGSGTLLLEDEAGSILQETSGGWTVVA